MDYLKEFVSLGVLLQPEALERLKQLKDNDIEKLINEVKEKKTLVLSEDFIKKTLGTTDFKVLKTFETQKTQTINNFVEALNKKFKILQEILLKKLELTEVVSINKCSSGKASIIGMIKDIKEKKENLVLELEDTTGTIKVLLPIKWKIPSLDDVVAISGKLNNNILFADKLIYPGIPFRRVNYSQEPLKLSYLKENNTDFTILRDKIRDNTGKTQNITDPCLLDINGIIILVASDVEPLEILNKRYIHKDNADFLIDVTPDIFFTNKDFNMNYKGISILGPNNIINLKTREVSNTS